MAIQPIGPAKPVVLVDSDGHQFDVGSYVPVIVVNADNQPYDLSIVTSYDAGAFYPSYWYTVITDNMTNVTYLSYAPTQGMAVVVTDVVISADAVTYIDLMAYGNPQPLFRSFLAANSTVQLTPRAKLKLPANTRLCGQASAAANVSITVAYYQE